MKLHINEANEKFDKLELSSYIQDCVEEALERLVDTKLTANVLAEEVPGYNQDWCADTFNSNYTKKIMQIVTDLTALYTDISLANRKDNE